MVKHLRKKRGSVPFPRSRAEGFVTVYMAAILSAIFLFQAVLLDFARVRAAQLQADFATAAAVRSIMSRVNPELREYGLFGLDGEGAMRLVEDIMAENLGSGRGETDTGVRHVRWTETRWLPESARLQFSDYLSEPGIFRIQVLEEMKYRAPIEYMLEVYDKVQSPGVMDNARDAASAARKLEQLEDLVKRLERSLDEAWDVVKELAEEGGLADQFRDANAKSLENIRQLAERLGEHSMEALLRTEQRLMEEIRLLELQLRELAMRFSGEGGLDGDGGQSGPGDELAAQLEELRAARQAELVEVRRLLDTARAYAAAIVDLYTKAGIQQLVLQERLETLRMQLDAARKLNDELKRKAEGLPEELRDAVHVYDPSYFDRRVSGMSAVVGLHNGYVIQLKPERFATGFDFTEQENDLSRLNDRVRTEAKAFHASIAAEELERQARAADIRERQEEERQRARDALGQARLLASFCPMEGAAGPAADPYRQLTALEHKYARGDGTEGRDSAQDDPPDPENSEAWDDAEHFGKQALGLGERMYAALLGLRDRAYMAEYALTKFNYRTAGSGADRHDAARSHRLSAQEAEYVLYGLPSCQWNHSAAFSEMFMLRLAIRTAEALMSPSRSVIGAASPWLVFLWALAEGAMKALDDMRRLVKGEEVELAKWLPDRITLGYRDYLRLLFLLHGREEAIIPRMQALIELNTGIDLGRKASRAVLNGEVRLPHLFLPGAAALLGKRMAGGAIILESGAEYAYQKEV